VTPNICDSSLFVASLRDQMSPRVDEKSAIVLLNSSVKQLVGMQHLPTTTLSLKFQLLKGTGQEANK